MPLFFLLSGYSLARSYGPRMSESKFEKGKLLFLSRGSLSNIYTEVVSNKNVHSSDLWPFRSPPKEFPSKYFYKARLGEWGNQSCVRSIFKTSLPDFLKSAEEKTSQPYFSHVCFPARVLPLYILSNLLCLPLMHWGFVTDGNPLFPEVITQEPNAAKLSSVWMTSVSHLFCSGVLEAGFESDLNFFSEQHLVPAPAWGSSFYNLMVSLMHPPQYQLIGRRSFILSTGPFPLSPSSTFSSPTFSPGPNHSVPLLELGTWPMPSTYSCWYASEKSCISG